MEQMASQQLLKHTIDLLPKYGPDWNRHAQVTVSRQSLSRVLYYDELYRSIVRVPGVICEFGVQWGATMSTLINLRGIYEPYNHGRRICGFDTFTGFLRVDERDGAYASVGDYSTGEDHLQVLEDILTLQESQSPIAHIKKFELIAGDAAATVDGWLERNPHAVIAMAIFDMDVYAPTRAVLSKILPRLTRGSLLVFDELNHPRFPGETVAVREVLGLNNLALKCHPHQPFGAWAVFDGAPNRSGANGANPAPGIVADLPGT